MDLLEDWWTYNRCYEIPRNYALWTILAVTGAITHKKLLYKHADLHFSSTLYVGLIGKMGNSKSTSKDFGKRIYEAVCPDIEIGPSRTSPEDLVKTLSSEETLCMFTDHEGVETEVRPCILFINEFKNFLGRSPVDMINLITDIYDSNYYKGGSIARGKEAVKNPAVNILMCETPDWMIDNLKGNLITGGIARRFVLVFEEYAEEPISRPYITPEASEAWFRVKQRLIDIRPTAGLYTWGDGVTLYDKWYADTFKRYKAERIPMMQGYLKTKHTQLFKVMMILDATSDKPMRVFSEDLFEHGLALLDVLEAKMPELGEAAGRNELMASQVELMSTIKASEMYGIKGLIQKKRLEVSIQRNLNPTDLWQVFRFLTQSEQIFVAKMTSKLPDGTIVEKEMVMIPETYFELKKKGVLK